MASNPPARLEVRFLGAVEIVLDGRRLRAFNSLRLQRFLALIALRRDSQHRSRLAFELWPDSDERQARTNLRKLIHDFRHSLPDIELEPTDEAAVRIQMEAHLALGDRTAALRSYHQYAEVLVRDLAVEPGEAIRTLYQQIQAGALNRDEVQGKDLTHWRRGVRGALRMGLVHGAFCVGCCWFLMGLFRKIRG